jgi:hypothetical protein
MFDSGNCCRSIEASEKMLSLGKKIHHTCDVRYSLISTKTFLYCRERCSNFFLKTPVTPDCSPLILFVSLFFIPSPKTTRVIALEGVNGTRVHAFLGFGTL